MPLNIDWQQILLHLLNFVILFAGLWLLLFRPVKRFMQKRKDHYAELDAAAVKKQAEAEEKRAEYEAQLALVDREIEERRAAARRELDGYEAMRKQAAEEEAEAIVSAARKNAVREKERALRAAREEIASLVTEAAEKIVVDEPVSQSFDRFLDAAAARGEEEREEQK